MLSLIGNFDFTELLLIAVVALMAFGKRLPEVAMRAAVQLARARRALVQMWREAGLEDELRRVRREVEQDVNLPRIQGPRQMVRDAGRRYVRDLERNVTAPEPPAEAVEPRTPPSSQAPVGRPAVVPDPPPEGARSAGQAGTPPPDRSEPDAELDLTPRPVRRPSNVDSEPGGADEERETA